MCTTVVELGAFRHQCSQRGTLGLTELNKQKPIRFIHICTGVVSYGRRGTAKLKWEVSKACFNGINVLDLLQLLIETITTPIYV